MHDQSKKRHCDQAISHDGKDCRAVTDEHRDQEEERDGKMQQIVRVREGANYLTEHQILDRSLDANPKGGLEGVNGHRICSGHIGRPGREKANNRIGGPRHGQYYDAFGDLSKQLSIHLISFAITSLRNITHKSDSPSYKRMICTGLSIVQMDGSKTAKGRTAIAVRPFRVGSALVGDDLHRDGELHL